MSKTINALLNEMKDVFGGDFGTQETEVVEDFSSSVKKQFKSNKSARSGADFRRDEKARISKNLSDFHKYADKEGTKSAARPRPTKIVDKTKVNTGGSSRSSGGGTATGQHHPFKRSKNLGRGPGTPPGFHPVHGSREHDEKKCWHCSCGNIYTKGCMCIGTGASKDCPRGRRKPIHVKKDYRKAYNKMYHKGYDQSIHRWIDKSKKK